MPSNELNERVNDRILTVRQKDGMDYAEDPSKFNPVVTKRHAIRLIQQESVDPEIIHRGVDTLVELRAINFADNRADRMLVLVEDDPTASNNGLFRYNEQETAPESLPFIVFPDDGVGRWIQVSKSNVFHNSMGQQQGGTITQRYHLTKDRHDATNGTQGSPSAANPFVTNSDTRMPTQMENDALQGTFGTPDAANRFVTNGDPRVGGLVLFEAEEVIPAYSAVFVSGALRIRKANPLDLAKMPSVGIVNQETSVGQNYPVFNEGYITNPDWAFGINKQIFVGLGGVLTDVSPTTGYYLSMGRSVSPTTIHLNIDKMIRI